MEDNIKKTLVTVCSLLEKYNVEYMLIGGTAVALHGHYRHSVNDAGELTEKPDVDIWYNPTYENYFRILKVMKALGYDVSEFKNEQSPNPRKSFFKLNFDVFTLDILPEIKANIKFMEAYNRKETVDLAETHIHFMNYSDLLADKKASARNKDFDDIQRLKDINEEE